MLNIWVSGQEKVRFNCDHVIPANPKTYGCSAEPGVHCCIFREPWHWARSFGQLCIFHCLYELKFALLQGGVTATWAFFQAHETSAQFYRHSLLFVYDLTLTAAFCPIFCFLDSFLITALSCVLSFYYSVFSLFSWREQCWGLDWFWCCWVLLSAVGEH